MIKKIGFVVLFTTLSTVQSLAHDFWIHSSSYTPQVNKLGAITNLYTGSGHIYPIDEVYEAKAEFKIVEGDKQSNLDDKLLGYKAVLKNDGNYLVLGKTNPAFYTQYLDNKGNKTWKAGTKEGLDNVISSKQFNRFAKAIISVGEAKDENYSKAVGQTLEIIPMQNPNKLKDGEYLTIKVLFNNKPLDNVKIVGTYSGFSNKGDFALATTTNKDGIANIKLNHSGYWLLQVEHTVKSPKDMQDKVDELFYSSTLTFQVQ
ncbi:DUF4198 domain-containing protein [Aliarcobacter vitoriensis]|uniref:DUF4198 domain-containing protein n=1 Tax=Aliarcobacter vitoriensis TaxID=2011099 RepID=A0A366MT26_9BACT|nr:DUF4198 domain-containing protein [Aliarcobacter vitoriensis]RBQ29401.1 hypothetical protein CRU91_04775 [Aliarcobacter vitoriensis]